MIDRPIIKEVLGDNLLDDPFQNFLPEVLVGIFSAWREGRHECLQEGVGV
jgi:hypothetical protein